MEKAFEYGVTFTVGRSVTTGMDNCVVWNGIHHKTSMFGGEYIYIIYRTNFGYPDNQYLKRVTEELRQKGIE